MSGRVVIITASLIWLAACATSGARDDATHARKSAVVAVAPSVAVDAAAAQPDAGAATSTQGVTAFFPVAEGACPSAKAYAVGTTAALVIKRDAWLVGNTSDAKPRVLYRMAEPAYDAFSGTTPVNDHIGQVGGLDESHAWVQLRSSTGRGEDSSDVFLRTPDAPQNWRTLATPKGQFGFFSLTHVIAQPDGSLWALGQHSMYLDIPGDSRDPKVTNHNRYFAWSPRGEPLKINLPGPDMADAVRMASSDLVAPGRSSTGKPMLRRWSPVKKVDDLVAANAPSLAADPVLALGTTRAVLFSPKGQQHAFYNYAGDKLQLSALSSRLRDVASWLLTSNDDLMVAAADGTLLIESKDGAISEEKLPEPGNLVAEPSVPWFAAKSGALYMRSSSSSSWVKLPLPDGPWLAETHPPSRVEWVKAIGGETWVSTVRTDVGFGLRKPGEVRVLYSSKPRPAPLRCGAPFSTGSLWPFPPSAGTSCTSLVVVVAAESEKEQKSDYPKLGAALKDDTTLGESLTFVGFAAGPGPVRLLGIVAPTLDIAKTLMKKLARVAPHAPELVCGAPDEQRRFSFRVKTGVFSTQP